MEMELPRYGSQSSDSVRIDITGTAWSGVAYIITAVIGSGMLSVAWAIAQFGWIAGPIIIIIFAGLAYCICVIIGMRNRTNRDAIEASDSDHPVSKFYFTMGAFAQIGDIIDNGYLVVRLIKTLNCRRIKIIEDIKCGNSIAPYMIIFGVTQMMLSQITCFDQANWWFAIVALFMVFIHATLSSALGIIMIVANKKIEGRLNVIRVGAAASKDQIWRGLQAIGVIAVSYSSFISEIKDKTPRAIRISVVVTTIVYLLCGCLGYAAFGDLTPTILSTGFAFSSHVWLVYMANVASIIELTYAYQIRCRRFFASVESFVSKTFPNSNFITKEVKIFRCKINVFRLVWRSLFVIMMTILTMVLPSCDNISKLLEALGFWLVYDPVSKYITQERIPKWSIKWVCLQMINVGCFIIAIAFAAGSVAGILIDFKS